MITTPAARGVLPEHHLLHLGFDPFAGSLDEVNALFERADLLLVLGAKLSDTTVPAGLASRCRPTDSPRWTLRRR